MVIIITIFIGAITLIISYPGLDYLIRIKDLPIIEIRNLLIILTSITIGIITFYMDKGYKTGISNHKLNFMIRDEHLRRMYQRLMKLDKAKLNREFEKIKKDYQEGKIKLPYS